MLNYTPVCFGSCVTLVLTSNFWMFLSSTTCSFKSYMLWSAILNWSVQRNLEIKWRLKLKWKILVMMTFYVQLQAWGLTVLRKMNSIADAFLLNLWSLQNITFNLAGDCLVTGFDSRQNFECISCFISSNLIQSQILVSGFQQQY